VLTLPVSGELPAEVSISGFARYRLDVARKGAVFEWD